MRIGRVEKGLGGVKGWGVWSNLGEILPVFRCGVTGGDWTGLLGFVSPLALLFSSRRLLMGASLSCLMAEMPS